MNKVNRLKILVRYAISKGIASNQRELGTVLGYTNESYFSQVINQKVPLADAVVKTIKKFIPDLNEKWLTDDDEENMLLESSPPEQADEDVGKVEYIYRLPVSAEGGTLNNFVVSVKESDCEKMISPIRGADFAMTITGDSMEPEYMAGSQIFIKKINEKAFIEWGRVYVLDTCNGTVIKKLMPGDTEGRVQCVSINPAYPPFQVSLSDVYGIYRVLLCMSLK